MRKIYACLLGIVYETSDIFFFYMYVYNVVKRGTIFRSDLLHF